MQAAQSLGPREHRYGLAQGLNLLVSGLLPNVEVLQDEVAISMRLLVNVVQGLEI